MNRYLWAFAISCFWGMNTDLARASVEENSSSEFYRLQPLSVKEVVPTAAELYSDLLQPGPSEATGQLAISAIDWGTIQLIGEKLIQIVQAGKPVGNVTRDAVSVVPGGVRTWDQLSGWKAPITKVYSVTAKNYLNLTVIDLRLKVSAMYGGGINGRGQYLANVIVVPTSVYVLWGFSCDVWAEHRDPVNTGSESQPIAGLGFDIRYRYGSALNEQIGTQDYFVSGAGEIKELD